MSQRIPAELFPPGDFIKEELEARGWAQLDLAQIMGSPPRLVSEIVAGKRSITPETARKLGGAFGTSALMWLNLENVYKLSKTDPTSDAIARRARLFEMAPVREMIKRGWISGTASTTELENELLRFFEIKSLEEKPRFLPHAARKSTAYEQVTPAQCAWLFRAKELSQRQQAKRFSRKGLREALRRLKPCIEKAPDVGAVPSILSDAGIRLVIVQHPQGTKIDGAIFWMDGSPVIALSLRYDRVDYFWFTLMHELGHVKNRDGLQATILDVDLPRHHREEKRPANERKADEFAAHFLVDPNELATFTKRTRPLYSHRKIRDFAASNRVHPGIVIGRLQHLGEISYAHSRKQLEKIREHVIRAALTDGWGIVPTEVLPRSEESEADLSDL